jgi:hypothetical protein
MRVRWLIGLLLFAGCVLSHDDFPGRSCATDRDCFTGQGERCDVGNRICIGPPDAAPPDAPPRPDAAADAEEDAL